LALYIFNFLKMTFDPKAKFIFKNEFPTTFVLNSISTMPEIGLVDLEIFGQDIQGVHRICQP